jgi:hypothetical protein
MTKTSLQPSGEYAQEYHIQLEDPVVADESKEESDDVRKRQDGNGYNRSSSPINDSSSISVKQRCDDCESGKMSDMFYEVP